MSCLKNNNSVYKEQRASKWDNFQFVNYLQVDQKEITNLPSGISVSTMSASCKLNTRLNIPNIEKYLLLNSDDIITVKQNDGLIRTLVPPLEKPKRLNKCKKIINENGKEVYVVNSKSFYNQITVVIRVNQGFSKDLNEVPKINVKLFRNGSVQMSGCKSLKSINIVLNKLVERLSEIKARFENNVIIEKSFIDGKASDLKIDNFKINMINSNYKVNMQIDREKLYNLLVKKKVKTSYEPCIRACVIIKFVPHSDNIDQKEVSIFVFQAGNIIITGARSRDQIINAYNYINNILITHNNDVVKKDEKEEEDLIMSVYDNIIKDINLGLIKVEN